MQLNENEIWKNRIKLKSKNWKQKGLIEYNKDKHNNRVKLKNYILYLY